MKMVSVTVRALILALAFGACIAEDFTMPESKCKLTDQQRIMKEMWTNFTECLGQVLPDADPKTAYTSGELSGTDLDNVGVCMNVKAEVIVDGKYLLEKVLDNVDEHMGATEETVKNELKEELAKCGTEKDAEEDCVEIMNCVHDTIKEVCEVHKIVATEQE